MTWCWTSLYVTFTPIIKFSDNSIKSKWRAHVWSYIPLYEIIPSYLHNIVSIWVLVNTGRSLTYHFMTFGRPFVQELSSCWNGWPFDHNRHGPKSWRGLLYPFPRESCIPNPHLTHCRLGRGLPLYQVASWSMQPFGHNRRMSQTDRTDNR